MLEEYRTLFPYLRKYRFRYAAGLACLIVVDGGQIIIPQYLKAAIDLVSTGSFEMGKVVRIAASLVLTATLISIGRFLWRFFIHGSSRRIETELRDRLFGRLMGLSSDFYQANKTGDLMARATNDMGAIRQATGMAFVTLFDGIVMSTAILVVMLAQNPRIALLSIAPLPIITILIVRFGGMVAKRFEKIQEIYSSLSSIAQETIAGIRVVKAFAAEEHFAEDFAQANDRYRDASLSLVRVFGFFFPFISFLSGLTSCILLLAGGAAVLGNAMSAGEIVATLAYLQMLIWPMMGAGFTVNTIQRGAASLKRVNAVLAAETSILSGPVAEPPGGSIDIRGLDFSYPGSDHRALRGLTLSLSRGATLGVLGRVGSGKSTFARLLPRLLDPPPGTVLIGGRDVRDYDLGSLRRSFGFVPQDSFLFSDTIEANVRFGAPDAGPERLERVAAIAAIDHDLASFPNGWSTLIGERGLTLSGGQKQRVAIARALLGDPEFLVLDDALSAVDAETEERVLQALAEERRGRTNVIVSHRVSTLRFADLVLVLDKGVAAQLGSHEELLADQDGFYAEVARLQELESSEASAGERP
jgi:ATP-binding cassette subfamily B multidrug efflux pump